MSDEAIDAMLQGYFNKVVREALEQHGQTIVEFAESSKKVREEAKAKIKAALLAERIEGKEEITAIGRERLDNDDMYTLDAWIEDSEVYIAKLKAQQAAIQRGSDE